LYFTNGSLKADNGTLCEAINRNEPKRRHRVAAVVEKRVAELWPELEKDLQSYFATHATKLELRSLAVVEGGEACKTESAARVQMEAFHQLGLDRQSVVLAIGGGALLDMVGYAAGTTHRGIRLVRMPTTVLGQSDSGIGVKNGINAFGKKNFLGTFAPPFAVINDIDFIRTLPDRDKVSGMAEAVKVALIKDRAFFDWLSSHADALARFEPAAMATLIQRCAELHTHHIATNGDPFELGSARPLDFGHWAAHKLESMSGFEMRHGEAVAIGLALDSIYSARVKLLSEADADQVIDLLGRIGFELWSELLERREPGGKRQVLAGLDEFREHLGGELTITLLTAIGRGVEVNAVSTAEIEASIAGLARRAKGVSAA
jgi:3-dehydroquinate synthase